MSSPATDTLDAAWQLIDRADSIAIVMHFNPDGDALGSGMALSLALQGLGKNAHLVCPQQTPDIYDFLSPADVIEATSPIQPVDLAIVVDCDRPDRVGELEPLVRGAAKVLVMDHHPPTSDFGDVRVTDQSLAATAEVTYYLLKHRNVLFTRRIAEALLTGLITDTGAFRYKNTQPDTLEVAAALARIGGPTADIVENVYETRTFAGLKLLARALESIQMSPAGTVVWAKLSARDFVETGARPEDTEGFVNLVHGLRGTDIGVILREEEPGSVRVSFRSRGESPVNLAAEALGGGGHELAAACVLEAPLDEAEVRVLDELKKWTPF